ncbi:alpha/beta hydrolase family protein [Alteromonas oceanisediminis]|uniref:alpha/beta hydrolase family protein n=1 Tax=Alteromonas oceanisediminis TaxID=2836180 RepID=UPI001BDAD48F|nr:alpha/beta fold hydrolase [Alteromonas oceanisediminis]MBT0587834.1 alpha/beta fold hydrolase [Alteromonas oceanisediminis]
MSEPNNNPQRISLTTSDGQALVGLHYQASQPVGVIIVASATGVPQGFYRKFALEAVARHYDVVTFDYRGIGESAPQSLRGYDMNYRDWGRYDLSAAIEYAVQTNLPRFLVGHSYGGHALGLAQNHGELSAAYTFGTGAGWHGWMPKSEQVRVLLLWHIIAPIIVGLKGYLGWSILGMGEDLPKGVYTQWKRWCGFPHYFFDDPDTPEMKAQFSQVRVPITAANAMDDKWAMPASRDAFMPFYSAAALRSVDIAPANAGLDSIGHMGYFRSAASSLWQDTFEFFERHTPTQ